MIFFGTGASRIKDGQINNVNCPNCNNSVSMNYSVFGKYFHLYWVPAFSVGRKVTVECNSCYKTYATAGVTPEIKSKLDFELQGTKVPVWHFAGVGIIVTIICVSYYLSSVDNKNDLEFISSPQIGDVYSIEGDTRGYYSAMKVSEVTLDSVEVIFNDYQTNQKSDIDNLDKESNYSNQFSTYAKNDLLLLFEEGDIFEVDRGE